MLVVMICLFILLVSFYQTFAVGQQPMVDNGQNIPDCHIDTHKNWMKYICPVDSFITDLDISHVNSTTIASTETLWVTSVGNTQGPLITLPSNICRFIGLKNLQLPNNQIHHIHINFTPSCLSELRTLTLSNNSLVEISVNWLNQMPSLQNIYLSMNNLSCLPYDAFNNVSHLRTLDVDFNSLTTMELWTIQVQTQVNYQFNKISRFSNYFNVDLSDVQIETLPTIRLLGNPKIYFDDTVYEMYNRCVEVQNRSIFSKTYVATLTRAILSIVGDTQPFYRDCDCNKYYFYRTTFAADEHSDEESFSHWICLGDSIPFIQKCSKQSSANFTDVIPRLCKINEDEPGMVPVYADSAHCGLDENITPISTVTITPATCTTTTPLCLEILCNEMLNQLNGITELNNSTVQNFIYIIDNANNRQNVISSSNISENTKIIYQKIILRIEHLIESLNSSLNISDAAVALVSSTKNDPVYYFHQFILSDSATLYSSASDYNNSIASISIDEIYINQLSDNKFYSFYFLRSSFFYYAQVNSRVEIVSPIVGASLPIESSLHVQMSFIDHNLPRSSGSYSCAFWQVDRWNDTGCIYSHSSTTHRHYCQCDHLTSFALIFTPNGLLRETFLPTIITSCFSMIGLFISIILSAHQQTKPQVNHRSRCFSIVNLLSLSSTLILFILFTALLIINYQSSTTPSTTPIPCSSSKLNLVLTTYFFVILTFITKTLLGIYYYFTTFVQFKPHLFNDRSDKWYVVSLLMIIMIALIPSVVASILSHQQNNVIVSNSRVCWFHGIYLINFIRIPISLLIGVNVIIVILISIRLFQFLCNTTADHAKEKRLIVATCMWTASCVLLGIIWIVGPLLNLFVNDNGQSTSTVSKAVQWIFALLTGLEGVWVLIVNILFYTRRRTETPRHKTHSGNSHRK